MPRISHQSCILHLANLFQAFHQLHSSRDIAPFPHCRLCSSGKSPTAIPRVHKNTTLTSKPTHLPLEPKQQQRGLIP
eukprot:17075_4